MHAYPVAEYILHHGIYIMRTEGTGSERHNCEREDDESGIESITRAEENMRINREHYKEGLTMMTVLLDAQRQQQQALSQYNAAVSEYLQAKTKYLILTGRRQNAL